jgi:hypothetical protein
MRPFRKKPKPLNNQKGTEPIEISPPANTYNRSKNINAVTEALRNGMDPAKYFAITLEGVVTTAEPSYFTATQLLKKQSFVWFNDGLCEDTETGLIYLDPYSPRFDRSQHLIVTALRNHFGNRNIASIMHVSKEA